MRRRVKREAGEGLQVLKKQFCGYVVMAVPRLLAGMFPLCLWEPWRCQRLPPGQGLTGRLRSEGEDFTVNINHCFRCFQMQRG